MLFDLIDGDPHRFCIIASRIRQYRQKLVCQALTFVTYGCDDKGIPMLLDANMVTDIQAVLRTELQRERDLKPPTDLADQRARCLWCGFVCLHQK